MSEYSQAIRELATRDLIDCGLTAEQAEELVSDAEALGRRLAKPSEESL
ncbi:hypothetical protein [Rhodococcus sp. BH5]|nr:hypothetical protein [Rhodococcus sp. BH5]MCZ9631336.1 hypothetical protein [Rhodococcus sp. BH5]